MNNPDWTKFAQVCGIVATKRGGIKLRNDESRLNRGRIDAVFHFRGGRGTEAAGESRRENWGKSAVRDRNSNGPRDQVGQDIGDI